jgi:hypothetical protein
MYNHCTAHYSFKAFEFIQIKKCAVRLSISHNHSFSLILRLNCRQFLDLFRELISLELGEAAIAQFNVILGGINEGMNDAETK